MTSHRLRLMMFSSSLIALIGVFWPQIADVAGQVVSLPDRGYIAFVPAVSLYLVFIRRSRIRVRTKTGGEFIGLFLVAASLLCSWYGHDRDLLVLWHAAPVVAFTGLLIANFGLERVLSFGPAVVVLLGLIPVPGFLRQILAVPLQGMATSITALILQELGFDAVRTGNLIELNGVQVAVGEACDGMRLLFPLAIVMYAFVYSLPLRTGFRVLLLIMCIPAALLCNVIRLVPTALCYGYFPDRAASVHDVGGWFMIPLAIALLVGFLQLLKWLDFPVSRFRLATA